MNARGFIQSVSYNLHNNGGPTILWSPPYENFGQRSRNSCSLCYFSPLWSEQRLCSEYPPHLRSIHTLESFLLLREPGPFPRRCTDVAPLQAGLGHAWWMASYAWRVPLDDLAQAMGATDDPLHGLLSHTLSSKGDILIGVVFKNKGLFLL